MTSIAASIHTRTQCIPVVEQEVELVLVLALVLEGRAPPNSPIVLPSVWQLKLMSTWSRTTFR